MYSIRQKKRGCQQKLMPLRVKIATLPQETKPVNNPVGTAPGVCVDVEVTVLFALPGVPIEMEAIFDETIAPLIAQAVGDWVFCEKSIFAHNITESQLSPFIDKVMSENLRGICEIASCAVGK